jgi:hypothetical protein
VARRRLLVCAFVLAVTGLTPGARGANGAGELTFYPQAGILWQDLYPGNFVDLDPGPVWPHLHFTSQVGGEVVEPWAGPCNDGPHSKSRIPGRSIRSAVPRRRAVHA